MSSRSPRRPARESSSRHSSSPLARPAVSLNDPGVLELAAAALAGPGKVAFGFGKMSKVLVAAVPRTCPPRSCRSVPSPPLCGSPIQVEVGGQPGTGLKESRTPDFGFLAYAFADLHSCSRVEKAPAPSGEGTSAIGSSKSPALPRARLLLLLGILPVLVHREESMISMSNAAETALVGLQLVRAHDVVWHDLVDVLVGQIPLIPRPSFIRASAACSASPPLRLVGSRIRSLPAWQVNGRHAWLKTPAPSGRRVSDVRLAGRTGRMRLAAGSVAKTRAARGRLRQTVAESGFF